MMAQNVVQRPSVRALLDVLGPGLVTGAADDDPSGIATYSQAGAQFGFSLLWTLLLTYPLMVGIQLASARIGRVTGHGLAANMRAVLPHWAVAGLVLLLLAANTFNIAADLAAMADAMELMGAGPSHVYVTVFGLVSLLLQVFVPYHRYVGFLKWLTLGLLAYVAAVFAVEVPWLTVARRTLLPVFETSSDYITVLVAVFGSTISPYLFFWQAGQEVEELRVRPGHTPLRESPEQAARHLRRMRTDTLIGMGFSNLIAFFIMLTAAATLHVHGITDIRTSAEAAQALRPIAGQLASSLFALGVVGTGLLAIPVLAGSGAYAVAESMGWRQGLHLEVGEARSFYSIIACSILVAILLDLRNADAMRLLLWSAVVNGIIAVPLMAAIMLVASSKRLLGPFVVSRRLKLLGWAATIVMALAAASLLFTLRA
jgi:NRAMP (natural resistance-associated macrophage protein)-like metal ion transporter